MKGIKRIWFWFTLVVCPFLIILGMATFGYKGYLQSSLILLLINTLAVIGSPATDIGNTNTLLFLPILFSISFGGVLLGVRKLTLKHVL
ncbi:MULTISPECIES: DUF6419 family natural product biosynthesis protein [unclassified Pseudoalteromonas]|uniref:DUF6419 family natural product biosynthesis protein n=1 Tax=unclassified Pseudoalteromonas TaxID=194690 RepID=UPI002872B073|nr:MULTISPECIES: DUF6419 family natural product biosynthesis protein [unclassified Pseudoalteromonas]